MKDYPDWEDMETYTTSEFGDMVESELDRARDKHSTDMVSAHEGLAVILEEFEEFKAEVFRQKVDQEALIAELVSTAAMCRRMYEDLYQ